jgi:hypothetical protein
MAKSKTFYHSAGASFPLFISQLDPCSMPLTHALNNPDHPWHPGGLATRQDRPQHANIQHFRPTRW